jgi:putative hydrolase of the HAD superfamily
VFFDGGGVGEATARVREVFAGRKGILFDLDGTLYGGPSCEPFFKATDAVTGLRVRKLVRRADPTEAFDAIEEAKAGDSSLRSKSDVLERRFGVGLSEMNRFRERFTDPEAHLRPDPEVAALLVALAPRFRLVLGTNNAPGLARRILSILGVDPGVFRRVATSEDFGAAKPDARFFRMAAAALELEPSDLVSVGDRPESDLAPAEELGFRTWRVASRNDLLALKALLPPGNGGESDLP